MTNYRSTIRQNKPNNLILKSIIEDEVLCEIETASIINKFAMIKSRKCYLNQQVCCFRQLTSTFLDYTAAMIKFVD